MQKKITFNLIFFIILEWNGNGICRLPLGALPGGSCSHGYDHSEHSEGREKDTGNCA